MTSFGQNATDFGLSANEVGDVARVGSAKRKDTEQIPKGFSLQMFEKV